MSGCWYNWGGEDLCYDVDYNFDADVDMDFDTDVDSNIDHDVDVDADVDIDGNSATFAIDIQAFGEDTATDLTLVVFVEEDYYSNIATTGFAAAE